MDFFLDPVHPRRTSALLLDQIRDAIADGRLRPGDRLPTSRFLAADLGVSRSTVTTVYDRLVAEGILEARVGDGTFVAQRW
ncbi:MAG: winged helix-turn-helix domain-containing protein, partial [Ilumatobacteraceae bacterium]